ncbi:MAG: hypothetical protein RSA09_00120 [Acinetobacter sp.]
MSVQIGQAYPLIVDKSGKPLDHGIIYIGESGQNPENYPIQIYYDEDFTIPAPQPLRTVNGYFSRNGSPAKIFINTVECSIVVKDKFKILQWLDLNYTGILSGSGIKASDVQDESGLSQQKVNNGVESIADLLAIPNPKDGNTQFVKSLDGGHFTYNESKASVNDGVIVYNGWVRITFEAVYRSEWVGVTGVEGDDCVPKLKKLFEYVAAKGGGTVVIQDGVHSLNTVYVDNTDGYTEHYAFGMYNNVTIEGTSRTNTIFKLKDNLTAEAPQRWGLFVDNHRNDIVNFTAKNFKVDFNGYNNLCTATLQPVYVVGLVWDSYTAKNITFDNIWCDKNASWNSFFIGTKCVDATIQNCLFTEHSDSIPNNLIKDHSSIYINGQNARVINNVFLMPDNVVSYISTGVEAHGVNTLVQGNLLRGYGAPFLAASTERDRQDDITFVSNIAKRAQIGIAYNSMFGTLKLNFIGNTVNLRKEKASNADGNIRYAHGAIESGGAINSIGDPLNSWTEIYVLNNTFEQEEPTDWTDADKYINICHSIKEAKILVSKGNTFKNFKGGALNVSYHRNFLGATHELSGNTYIGCGSSTAQNAYQAAYRLEGLPFMSEGGVDYNLLDKIMISNETFNSCGYGAVLGRQDDLTARQIDITDIKYIGNFIPPAALLKPIDIISGHTVNIEYSTNGFVLAGQTLLDAQGLSGSISLKHWSSTTPDDFLLTDLNYRKTPAFPWNMMAVSSNIPSNAVQFGAFPNKDGDRIDAVAAPPSGASGYVRSNNVWYRTGILNSPI